MLALTEITVASLSDFSVRRTESSVYYETGVSKKATIPVKMRGFLHLQEDNVYMTYIMYYITTMLCLYNSDNL